MRYKEFQVLLSAGKLQESPELTRGEFDTHKYYTTDAGVIILYLPSAKHIQTFASKEEYKAILKKIEKASKVKGHMLEPYKERIDEVKQFVSIEINNLSKLLQIGLAELDYSKDSLKKIDFIRKKNKITYDDFFDRLYFPIVVYLGETIRRQNNGVWIINKKEKFSELFIQLQSKKLINVFSDLYKEANESFKSFSVFAIYERVLLDLRL